MQWQPGINNYYELAQSHKVAYDLDIVLQTYLSSVLQVLYDLHVCTVY